MASSKSGKRNHAEEQVSIDDRKLAALGAALTKMLPPGDRVLRCSVKLLQKRLRSILKELTCKTCTSCLALSEEEVRQSTSEKAATWLRLWPEVGGARRRQLASMSTRHCKMPRATHLERGQIALEGSCRVRSVLRLNS